MKQITKLKYTDEALNWVSIEFDDGSRGQSSLTDNVRRQYTDIVDEYLAKGGVIEPMFTAEEIAKQELCKAQNEALKYLKDTDFYFTIDKYAQLSTEEADKLKAKRQEARDTINKKD